MVKKFIPKAHEVLDLQRAIITQMLALSVSSFGLVAALAWNEVIKEFVESYIKPYMPQGSGLISLFLYAVLITAFAVAVTLQLTKVAQRLNPECIHTKK